MIQKLKHLTFQNFTSRNFNPYNFFFNLQNQKKYWTRVINATSIWKIPRNFFNFLEKEPKWTKRVYRKFRFTTNCIDYGIKCIAFKQWKLFMIHFEPQEKLYKNRSHCFWNFMFNLDIIIIKVSIIITPKLFPSILYNTYSFNNN